MTDDASGFKITPEQLKAALTPKTKMLILTSPSNPTGAVYTREELTAIGKVLEGTDVIVASDEMYEKLIYDGEFTSAAAVSDDMFKRTITINGLSKSVAMTGWRFGYMAAANTEIIQATKKLQSQSTSNINSITQKAAIVGLNGDADADIEALIDQADVGAHDARKHDVADPVIDSVLVRHPGFLHEAALHADLGGDRGDHAGVVRLHAADRDQRVGVGGDRIGDDVFELAQLVAAIGEAGIAVLALGIDLDLAAEMF